MDSPTPLTDRAPGLLALAAAALLAWGAFALLKWTDDVDLSRFWIRLAVGLTLAAATVWAAATRRWLTTTFLALAACVTPVADDWGWVPILFVALSIWTLVKFLADIMQGRRV